MQASSWLALLKQMPQSQHDNLSMVTTVGTEVAIQQIVRLERDFLVVRGRMTGTMDTGVIIVVPYDQISYLNFVKKLAVEDVNEMFKGFQAPALAVPAVPYLPGSHGQAAPADDFRAVEFSDRTEEAEKPAEPEAAEEPARPGGKPGEKGKQVSKSLMLARLRARLNAEKGPHSG